MAVKVGSRVRSYDFKGVRNCYAEGRVEKIGPWEGCGGSCPHIHIAVERWVYRGVEVAGPSHAFPAAEWCHLEAVPEEAA